MHDLLEGICSLEVHLVLAALIQDGYFTLDLLNSRITSFDYGIVDSKNKPSVISASKLQKIQMDLPIKQLHSCGV